MGEEAQIGAECGGDPKAAEQLGHSCVRKTPHVGSAVCLRFRRLSTPRYTALVGRRCGPRTPDLFDDIPGAHLVHLRQLGRPAWRLKESTSEFVFS